MVETVLASLAKKSFLKNGNRKNKFHINKISKIYEASPGLLRRFAIRLSAMISTGSDTCDISTNEADFKVKSKEKKRNI